MEQTGRAEQLAPGLRRILAPNPSAMTLHGTNTYLLGHGALAVIDPGPDDKNHLAAIRRALAPGEWISHILVTHSHLDHAPLARALSRETGAPVLAFGDSSAGRRADLARLSGLGGGEGVDRAFRPDRTLADGETVQAADWSVTALHMPGHMGNHLCFVWGDAVFTGDHVMAWASSMISPPDGDLGAYMKSLDALARRRDRVFYPGHGAPVTDPSARLAELIAHRRSREAQILAALRAGPADAATLTRAIYTDVDPALHPAALRTVIAHLVDLINRKIVTAIGPLALDARFDLR